MQTDHLRGRVWEKQTDTKIWRGYFNVIVVIINNAYFDRNVYMYM